MSRVRSLQDQKFSQTFKDFSAYFQRLFKDLYEKSAVEKLQLYKRHFYPVLVPSSHILKCIFFFCNRSILL
jgi:hypothetical protein